MYITITRTSTRSSLVVLSITITMIVLMYYYYIVCYDIGILIVIGAPFKRYVENYKLKKYKSQLLTIAFFLFNESFISISFGL